MLSEIPDFSNVRILVAGDIMLDRYWHGDASRISPEAPVPVVRVENEEYRAGGAGNVALNISVLGGRAALFGVVGRDEAAGELDRIFAEGGIERHIAALPDCTTITKLRVVSRHQHLVRIDFEDGFPAYPEGGRQAEFERVLNDCSLLILSDYAKGTLRDIRSYIDIARRLGKPVLADPKGSDFERYRGATLLTPNLGEFEAVVGRCGSEEEMVTRAEGLLDRLELEALLVTRGERGMTLVERGKPARHLPAHAREVFDVTGAGDTVISVLATALAAGMPLEAATHLANVAAGVVVGKLGTASASLEEIHNALLEHEAIHRGLTDEEELVSALELARGRGETIVFTNGCFDILHAGHVAYLEQAARLGDRLVVAVNTDDTVRRLKGPDRPINPVEQRMAVLVALGCVDWVLAFSEDTPERLIRRLRPDFLVKGGDNQPDQIPGAAAVRAAGGEVRVMDYLQGCSTTRIVDDIRSEPRLPRIKIAGAD
jgi:D-beta-D-heptose 7-phosphate kinase/D-beta-D-heptose 1-phosphate adenosyltransferase